MQPLIIISTLLLNYGALNTCTSLFFFYKVIYFCHLHCTIRLLILIQGNLNSTQEWVSNYLNSLSSAVTPTTCHHRGPLELSFCSCEMWTRSERGKYLYWIEEDEITHGLSLKIYSRFILIAYRVGNLEYLYHTYFKQE